MSFLNLNLRAGGNAIGRPVWVVLALWFVAAWAAGAAGAFTAGPAEPPVALLAAVAN